MKAFQNTQTCDDVSGDGLPGDGLPGDGGFLTQMERYGRAVFSPVGYSMYPMLRDGRDVVVLEKPARPIRPGDVALYRNDAGDYVLHRVVRIDRAGIELLGDGRVKCDPVVTPDRVLGVMTAFYRHDRMIGTGNPLYRAYALFWRATRRHRRGWLRLSYRLDEIRARAARRIHAIRK